MEELAVINSCIVDEIKSSVRVQSVFQNTLNLIHEDTIITLGKKQYLTKGPNRIVLHNLPNSISLNSRVSVSNGKIIIDNYFIDLCYSVCREVVFFEPKIRDDFLSSENIADLWLFLSESSIDNYFQYLKEKKFAAIKMEQFRRFDNLLAELSFHNINRILGLGEGLTPSSDDFLLGYCIAKNIFDFDKSFNAELLKLVKLKTNILSYNFFYNALRGYLSVEWENLLNEMDSKKIKIETLEKIKSFGATSGVYMLSGFLAYLVKEIGGIHFEKDFS